ncbi:hypothetical protein SDC9_154508 [bioreactor metagenome]|uniref:Uncharacterized protein n=1 Tax=bioreactor metagenome TaxID=1076179 RepID=A0A645F157_9ZZZZ
MDFQHLFPLIHDARQIENPFLIDIGHPGRRVIYFRESLPIQIHSIEAISILGIRKVDPVIQDDAGSKDIHLDRADLCQIRPVLIHPE